jgi:type VI secretion system protein ImpH
MEPVRFRHDPDLVFHAGDVSAVKVTQEGGLVRAVMTTTFLGLTGAASPLATVFAEDVLRAELQEESSLRNFYDLFHHRLISLFYRTWKKYRFTAGFHLDGADTFTRRMLSFVGVDLAGPPKRGLEPLQLLALCPLLATRTRPERTLHLVLEMILPKISVAIETFVLRKVSIRPEDQCTLRRHNNVIGQSFVIGRQVSDRSGRFRIVLGPVDFPTFQALMPGGARHDKLRDVVLQFSPYNLEAELEVILGDEHSVRFQLGNENGARLGVNTHLPREHSKGMRGRVVLSYSDEISIPQMFPGDSPPADGASATTVS